MSADRREDGCDSVVVADRFRWRDLLHKEDWLSIWAAFILIAVAAVGALTGWLSLIHI